MATMAELDAARVKGSQRRCNDLVKFIEIYAGIWRVQTTRCTRCWKGEQQDQSDKAAALHMDLGLRIFFANQGSFPKAAITKNKPSTG